MTNYKNNIKNEGNLNRNLLKDKLVKRNYHKKILI